MIVAILKQHYSYLRLALHRCFLCRQADLHTIQKQLRAAQRQLQRVRCRERNHGCTHQVATLCVGVYVLSGHDMETAVAVARRVGLSEGGDGVVDTVPWEAVIAEWYLQATQEAELAWHFPGDDQQAQRRQEALVWICEYRTVRWVRSQNIDHGVAPSSIEVLATFVDHVRKWGDMKRLPSLELMLEASGRSARQWSLRFRRRWQIHLGRLKVREPCTPAELHAKVPEGNYWFRLQG